MTTVIIDETCKEGQEILQILQKKEYATVLEDNDWWCTITEEERRKINRGLQDLANGRTQTHEQVRKLYEEWL